MPARDVPVERDARVGHRFVAADHDLVIKGPRFSIQGPAKDL
jgi:hypothetical protein